MILCRFADQTAVQLPPQRRLIGMCFHRTAAGESTSPMPGNKWIGSTWGKLLVHLSLRKHVLPGNYNAHNRAL